MAVSRAFLVGAANIILVEKMYTKYLLDPYSIDPSWRELFDGFEENEEEKGHKTKELETFPATRKAAPPDLRIYSLIQAYRTYGHLMANINPIATHEVKVPWQLDLEHLGIDRSELSKEFPTNGLLKEPIAPLEKIINTLQKIYCGTVGIEYMGVQNPELEQWLHMQIEPNHFKIDLTIDQKKMILQYLNKSELFEVFLHTKYTGQKRFSLEGGETLIPILAAVINTGADVGMDEFVLGMAHRGRLNVLANILNKSYSTIFSEFEEGYIPVSFEGSGDVKYHKGFTSQIETMKGEKVRIDLTPNPSHLEAVNPVVEGQVRAKQVKYDDDVLKERIIPVLIHGDAAISGQGIVYETMQLYRLKGYSTGGTIHIVINNQIGFTTLPSEGRSTKYCSDIAKTFGAPVFHVNAEDPEGCIHATNLAVELRQKFHCDVVIDLNCWRKFGHNEADEPAFTQPLEYQIIRKKKPIREIYRDDLISQGVLERQMAEALEEEFKESLKRELQAIKIPEKKKGIKPTEPKEKQDLFARVQTGVNEETLKEIARRFTHVPEGLTVHTKLEKLIQDRKDMGEGNKPIDWGMGEMFTYATLLWEGVHVRLAGQDVCRGTFSHRHAMWMDQEAEKAYFPLKHLKRDQARFDIINSPLSEYACLGFEYGYSLAYPEALVIWEAQFGDFANGAQVIIDQFISSAEQKWAQKDSVTMLLPHGYEGQGPEHSSARLERFLQLCADDNLIVADPTTPAQLFHLLRRQALKPMGKPLIVMTPKGLLRLPECVSSLDDLSQGSFQEILDDPNSPKKVERLVFCTGRFYYDLIKEREKSKSKDMAIVRIEQLYPLHVERLKTVIQKYDGFKECFWVQEEPENMGAWNFIRPKLSKLLPGKQAPAYAGRESSASPAAGSFALHNKKHKEIMEKLFG